MKEYQSSLTPLIFLYLLPAVTPALSCSMMTAKVLGALLFIALVVGVTFFLSRNHLDRNVTVRATQDHREATAASSPPRSAILQNLLPQRRGVPPAGSPESFKPQHQVQTAPGDLAKEATAEANAGSPEAMRQLSQALLACARADMGSDEEIEQKVAKRSIGRELLKDDSSIFPNVSADAHEVARLEGIRDSCKQLTKGEIDQGLSWLERSAAAGDSEARAGYAWTLLNDFPTAEAKEDNAEEYIRRRDLAFGFLQDSIANGDCTNGILNGFRTVTSDPISTYVYQSLLLQHALEDYGSGRFPPDVAARESASVSAMLNYLASNVPVDQRAAAENTTRDILQNYCTDF